MKIVESIGDDPMSTGSKNASAMPGALPRTDFHKSTLIMRFVFAFNHWACLALHQLNVFKAFAFVTRKPNDKTY